MQRELEARPARLAHLQQRAVPLPHVADANVGLDAAAGREVLTEGGVTERLTELHRPAGEVFARVRVHGLVGSAVNGQVGLRVAREVSGRQPECRFERHGMLRDRAVDLLRSVPEALRRTDVDLDHLDHD